MMLNSFVRNGLDRSMPHIGVIMEKFDTDIYPKHELHTDYHFSQFKKGFEKQWARLQFEVGQINTFEEAETSFFKEFYNCNYMNWIKQDIQNTNIDNFEDFYINLLSERMIFVVDKCDNIVGTGSLWGGNTFGSELERLHWMEF